MAEDGAHGGGDWCCTGPRPDSKMLLSLQFVYTQTGAAQGLGLSNVVLILQRKRQRKFMATLSHDVLGADQSRQHRQGTIVALPLQGWDKSGLVRKRRRPIV